MSRKIERDEITGTDTTGHEWDGIKELNTPLPRWWLYTFYGCVVWALGYSIAYPAWPLINGATPGLLGYSSRADVKAELEAAKTAQGANLDKIAAASVDDILKDPDMLAFARAGGAAAFKVNCVQCHGSGAAGSPGYPNLNDDEWIWGGNAEAIYVTLKNGIRYAANPDTRVTDMLVFGPDPANGGTATLTPEQIVNVSNYVLALGGDASADATAAEAGKQIYTENCAACHGDDAKGNRDMGAPNLTDKIWLYGGTIDHIKAQVSRPRNGVMPAWSHRLSDATVKQLAVYVHSLGGGEAAP
jgi:cytochrome c oxidase cbb3-type subunit III